MREGCFAWEGDYGNGEVGSSRKGIVSEVFDLR